MSAARRGRPPAARWRIAWTRRAEADLEAIGDTIAADSPIAAERWVSKLLDRAKAAADAPLAGRVVPEIRRSSVREVFLKTYRIVYRVYDERVVVLTVFEGHRRLPSDIDVDDDPDAA